MDVENFADGRARLLEYKVQSNPAITGKKVKGFSLLEDQKYILEQITETAEAKKVDEKLAKGEEQ